MRYYFATVVIPLEFDGDVDAATKSVEQKLASVVPIRSCELTEVSSMELAIMSGPGKPGPRP